MPKKLKRDSTVEEQLARGPVDMPFLILVVLLTGIGVVMVFSASYATAFYDSYTAQNDPAYYFIRQLIFSGLGLAGMWLASKINYEHWRWGSVFVLGFAILLLVLVLVPGVHTERTDHVRRWIKSIGPIPAFQPSEVAKLGVILYFSARLSKRNQEKPHRLSPRSLWSGPVAWLDKIGFLELIPYIIILALPAYLE